MIGFYIMQSEKLAMYTVFLMTGGMTVPYVWGVLFLNEELSPIRTAGLVIIAAAVVMLNLGKERPKLKSTLLCALVFFLNGFVSVVSKEHQLSLIAVSSPAFVMLSGLSKSAVCSVLLLIVYIKNRKKEHGCADFARKKIPSVSSFIDRGFSGHQRFFVSFTADRGKNASRNGAVSDNYGRKHYLHSVGRTAVL